MKRFLLALFLVGCSSGDDDRVIQYSLPPREPSKTSCSCMVDLVVWWQADGTFILDECDCPDGTKGASECKNNDCEKPTGCYCGK